MKKQFKTVWIVVCCSLALVLGIQLLQKETSPNNTIQKEIEIQSYNDMINSSTFIKSSYKELKSIIEDKKTEIYYLGYADCPWCEDAVPVLKEVLDSQNMKIKYLDTKELKKNDDEFQDTKRLLSTIVGEDDKLYVPQVIVILKGEVIANHQGTLDEHDANERDLTSAEQDMLKEIYEDLLFGGSRNE